MPHAYSSQWPVRTKPARAEPRRTRYEERATSNLSHSWHGSKLGDLQGTARTVSMHRPWQSSSSSTDSGLGTLEWFQPGACRTSPG